MNHTPNSAAMSDIEVRVARMADPTIGVLHLVRVVD